MDSKNLFNIELINNKGKQWYQADDCYVKGFAFYGDKLLENKKLADIIRKSITDGNLASILNELNGNFTAVVIVDTKAYLISDKIRSYPLIFAKETNGKFYITDSAIGINRNKEVDKQFDNVNCAEFLSLGYVSGNDTLCKDIHTVDAGEYVIFRADGIEKRISYFKYIFAKEPFDKVKTINEAYNALESAFKRTVKSIRDGVQIVIPLSGGYDSRLIACLCKKYGLQNVVCYTYGRKESFEVSTSEIVAKQLGFEWHYVEYTSIKLAQTLESSSFKKFSFFTNNCNSIPHIQEFLALSELKSKGIIKDKAIILPGFCGDVFGGSKIPNEIFTMPRGYTHEYFVLLIYRHFYDLNTPTNKAKKLIRSKILNQIKGYDVSSEDKFLNHYEQWCISNRLAKYIINSIRVYEFFELDWRLPLWDDDYAKAWYKVPWHNKNSELLADFMFTYYFNQFGVSIKKSSSSVNNKWYVKFLKRYMPYSIKFGLMKAYGYLFSAYNQRDINCFETAAYILLRKVNINLFHQLKKKNSTNILAVMSLIALQSIAFFSKNNSAESK